LAQVSLIDQADDLLSGEYRTKIVEEATIEATDFPKEFGGSGEIVPE
jgi:hypothetical protein